MPNGDRVLQTQQSPSGRGELGNRNACSLPGLVKSGAVGDVVHEVGAGGVGLLLGGGVGDFGEDDGGELGDLGGGGGDVFGEDGDVVGYAGAGFWD